MLRTRSLSMMLAVALLASVPAASTAQEDTVGPEGVDWSLTGYLVEGELVDVPLDVEATLLLEAGTASGSGGCNQFTGSYQLDGTSLSFDDEMTRTLMACPGDADAVEDAYLSTLLEVSGWVIDDGQLELSDDFGDVVLSFEELGRALTARDLAVLLARLEAVEAELATVQARMDAININRLRARIRALEEANEELRRQIEAARRTPAPTARLNAAERVLLEGVPDRIASRCQPLRERLPAGTAAAVQCSPNTSIVSEMAYYLLDDEEAVALYRDRMQAQGVELIPEFNPEGIVGCWEGGPSYGFAPGGYIGGVGCYVEDGRANLRIIQEATNCKQMRVGGTQLQRPVMYVAMTGSNQNIERLYDWAMRNKPQNLISGLVEPIPRPDSRRSPTCGS